MSKFKTYLGLGYLYLWFHLKPTFAAYGVWLMCNWMHTIQQVAFCQPSLGYCNLTHLNRRDGVILRRLRIGHTRLTHQYLLRREVPPQCPSCNCALTVVHIILECQQYNSVRQKYVSITTLKELFDRVSFEDILSFLRDIHLYSSYRLLSCIVAHLFSFIHLLWISYFSFAFNGKALNGLHCAEVPLRKCSLTWMHTAWWAFSTRAALLVYIVVCVLWKCWCYFHTRMYSDCWSVMSCLLCRSEEWGRYLSSTETQAHCWAAGDLQQWWPALHGLWIVSKLLNILLLRTPALLLPQT